MHRLFGRKKEAKPAEPKPSLEDAIGRSDGRVEALNEKIKRLDRELIGYKNQLKKMTPAAGRTVKQRAMQALKRKKMLESQRDQIMATQFNMERTSFAVETAKETFTTVEAMRGAAAELKAQAKVVDVDSVEDLQDELADLMMDADEINELMGRSYGMPDEVDEADLEDELAGLEDEWAEEEAAGATASETPAYLAPLPAGGGGGLSLPEAPTGVPVDAHGLPVAESS